MNLICEKTFNKDSGRKILNLIKSVISSAEKDEDYCFAKLISYENFENVIHDFILDVMKTFLESNKIEDECLVFIKRLPKGTKGYFLESKKSNNFLVINECVIKELYDGDIEQFIAIFHELNHFKVKYDISLSEINDDIVRIVKEKLIRESSRDPFNEIGSIKSIKKGYIYVNDDYYGDNYKLYSGEVYANIKAQEDYLFMLKSITNNPDIQADIINFFQSEYKGTLEKNKKYYDNHQRDFRSNFKFNSFFLSYEEAFDLLIKNNPDWLQYPQIAIEYYKDDNGIVHKRNESELIDLFNNTENLQQKDYIKFLIEKNDKKDNNKKL